MNKNKKIEDRKLDHIELTALAQTNASTLDRRFDYEPMLSSHPSSVDLSVNFLGKRLKAPIWVSSMTGGAIGTESINVNLAKACSKHGVGMALGSCRALLEDESKLSDFDVRPILGDSLPLYANLGIAQIEKLLNSGEIQKVVRLIELLRADGLIVHINPMQEFFQPEGDQFESAPVDIIERLLDSVDIKIIVKEVGQGIGPRSLEKLISLPIEAIEFGAFGGTNFSKIEQLRSDNSEKSPLDCLVNIGHTADEMVNMANQILLSLGEDAKCKQFIVSGGINSCLDGYCLLEKLSSPAVYGCASRFLAPAAKSFTDIDNYLAAEIEGLKMANAYLAIRK